MSGYGFVADLDHAQKLVASAIGDQHKHVDEVALQIVLAIDCGDPSAARGFAAALRHQVGGLADDEIAPSEPREEKT